MGRFQRLVHDTSHPWPQRYAPNGSEMTKDDYLGALASGELRYQVFEPISEMAVLGDASVVVLRYQARISFDDGPGSLAGTPTATGFAMRDGK